MGSHLVFKNSEVSHSNALPPIHIDTLTGLVRVMATSTDVLQVMKENFKSKELGLWFTQSRTSNGGEFDRNKITLHIVE